MASLDDIKKQRRDAFNAVMTKIITPVTGTQYVDHPHTYIAPSAGSRIAASMLVDGNPSSAAAKAQKAQKKTVDDAFKTSSKNAKANAKAKTKDENDYLTVQKALDKSLPLTAPDIPAKQTLQGSVDPVGLTAGRTLANQHPLSRNAIQQQKIDNLAPEQFAALPLSVQKIYNERKTKPDNSPVETLKAPTVNDNSQPQNLHEALGERPDVYALTQDELNSLGSNATAQDVQKATRDKFTTMLVKANQGQGALGLNGQVQGNEGWIDRNIVDHLPSPVKTGISKTFDYLDRPRNAIVSGLRGAEEKAHSNFQGDVAAAGIDDNSSKDQVTEFLKNRLGNGANPNLLEGYGKGAFQGFKGEKHTGFGDIIEDAFPKSEFGNNAGVRWAKRGAGFTGDIVLDPTTYFSFGLKNILKAGAKGVEDVGEQAFKDAVAKGADQAVAESARQAAMEGAKQGGKQALSASVKSIVSRSIDKQGKLGGLRLNRTVPVGSTGVTKTVGRSAKDLVLEETQKAIDKIVYDVAGGPQAGKSLGSAREIADTVANVSSESVRSAQLEELKKFTDPFLKGLKNQGPKFNVKQLASAVGNSAIAKVWHDAFKQANFPRASFDTALKKADEAASAFLETEARDFSTQVSEEIRRSMLKIPTLRTLGGHTIAEFPRVGKAVAGLSDKVGQTSFGEALHKARDLFSYTSNFPGYSTLLGQKVRSEGLQAFNDFKDEVVQGSQGVSRAERTAIQHAMDTGTVAGLAPELQAKAGIVDSLRKRIRDDEVAAGIKGSDPASYLHLRSNKSAANAFKIARDAEYTATGKIVKNTIDEAKRLKLKPVEDSFENLLYRKLESNRKLTNVLFKNDLASHYGIQSTMNALEAKSRGLVKLTKDHLPQDLQKTMKDGHELFLDHDINEIRKKFERLSEPGSLDNTNAIKAFDYLTRKFKTLNTIYYPGFHVRNMISDLYMGMLDGVSTRDYGNIINKIVHGARNPNLDMDIGGRTVKWIKFKDAFEKDVSSGGFLNAELGETGKLSNKLGAVNNGIRNMSEKREDFGRMAHFKHAMDEELPAALKQTKNFDQAWDQAVNASLFRVNKYKFDYGALTKFEQTYMRRGIPFYTYMRKAIPTLAEATVMSPRLLNYTNRWMNDLMPKDRQGAFDSLDLPDWLKDVGFAEIPGQEDSSTPWGITGQALPQDTFNRIGSVKDVAAQANPLIRGPFELAYKKSLYNNKPINNVGDLIQNNIRAFNTYDKMFDGSTDIKERLANIMGLPVVQVNEAKQAGQRRKLVHDFKAKVGTWNEEAKKKGYTLNLSARNDGVSLRITRTADGKTRDFENLDEALQFLGLRT